MIGTLVVLAALTAGPEAVVEARLKNGLEVVIWPDARIPNVALYFWYRVGSRNEAPGITGVSHFFEHMMFNGAKKYGPGEFDRVMEANGGSNNAFTSNDVTVYQDWFPKSALPVILDLERDRIGALAIDPKMVESERQVVYSERRMRVDDDNASFLDEQIRATAFHAHPYQIPVIGWPSDIESWSIEDLRRHFRTYYAPNNCTVVAVGDVDPKALLRDLERTLGKIPRQPAPRPVAVKEPVQRGVRRLQVIEDTPITILEIVWHAPAAAAPDWRRFDLLRSLLSGGESSRLHRRLVETERVALSVSAWLDGGFDPGLFTVQAELNEGVEPGRVEALIFEELRLLARDGPSPDELDKVRRQSLMAYWSALETIDGKAQALGTFHTFHGGWRNLFELPKTVESITGAEIAAAAGRLTVDKATIGVLGRAGAPPAAEPAEKDGVP